MFLSHDLYFLNAPFLLLYCSMASEWRFLVRWFGQIVDTPAGPDYVEGYFEELNFYWRVGLDELKDHIVAALRLRSTSQIVHLAFRCPTAYVPFSGEWWLIPLVNDEDVHFIFHCLDNIEELECAEVYVEVESASSSLPCTSTQYRGGLDLNVEAEKIFKTECGSNASSGEHTPDSDSSGEEEDITPETGFRLHESPSNLFNRINLDDLVASNKDVSGSYPQQSPESGFLNIFVGQSFKEKDDLLMIVKEHNYRTRRDYATKESDKKSLYLVCAQKNSGCPWKLRACKKKNALLWEITKYKGPHTCFATGRTQDHRHVDNKVIVATIKEDVILDPSIKIKRVIAVVQKNCRHRISYKKAWKAKQNALAEIFGGWFESYEMLPEWLLGMQQTNPGTIVDAITEDCVVYNSSGARVASDTHSMLRRIFWSFKPCIDAFQYCRPVIQVDGTHLYGKYRGILLIAGCIDGDNHLLPLAFAIVEAENNVNWAWFMQCVRTHVVHRDGVAVISDRHASIARAMNDPSIGWAEPAGIHRFCLRHFVSNHLRRFKDNRLRNLLYYAGKLCHTYM